MENYPYPSFEAIYETMTGMREKEYCVPFVEDAFAEGSVCDKWYEEMRQAYERICDRLGVQNEDKDLDIMVQSMEKIQKELCRRIYYLTKE